jgi:hypothetical protein
MANSVTIREEPRWMLSGNEVFRTSGTVADCGVGVLKKLGWYSSFGACPDWSW